MTIYRLDAQNKTSCKALRQWLATELGDKTMENWGEMYLADWAAQKATEQGFDMFSLRKLGKYEAKFQGLFADSLPVSQPIIGTRYRTRKHGI